MAALDLDQPLSAIVIYNCSTSRASKRFVRTKTRRSPVAGRRSPAHSKSDGAVAAARRAAVLSSVQQLGSVVGLALLVGPAAGRSGALTAAGVESSRALTGGLGSALTAGAAVLMFAAALYAWPQRKKEAAR
ncbi:MAG TPA: hypothetical protein VHF92_15725 [Geodermatophilus sp.]|nr:hypothetical protein [Geodermatophilus sp.]